MCMQAMCQEAVKAGKYSVAVQVLVKLHEQLIQCTLDLARVPKGGQVQEPSALTEASILSSLIMCIIPGMKSQKL
jgi:hypothetical protein